MDRLTKKITHIAPLLAILLIWPFLICRAATIGLETEQTKAAPGQTIDINITLDTGRECINAAEVSIEFPPEKLQLSDFSRGGSILTFWTEFPDRAAIDRANKTGQLTFSGGMPGGYCSNMIKGAGINNLLGKLVFKVPGFTVGGETAGAAQISVIDSTRVYLNDGMGTDETVLATPLTISIDQETPRAASGWEQSLKSDQSTPEFFTVAIQRDETLFDGKYFAIFFTTDKQTGIDYYEIKEEKIMPDQTVAESAWEKGESPYVLKDQALKSRVSVRAIDKAGNMTEANYIPEIRSEKVKENGTPITLAIAAAATLLAGGLVWFVGKKRIRAKR